jgi:alkylation response protein AidB-like acyl-CoA dehydrogenase
LSADGSPAHREVLEELVSGSSVAAWCMDERYKRLGEVDTTIDVDGDDVVVNGIKRPVSSATHAQHLLITGRSAAGLTQVLVPLDSPGVSVKALSSLDVTRRFGEVALTNVRVPRAALVGAVGQADEQVARQLRTAVVILTAEAVGAMRAAFDMTVEWAFDRYSFGRPLASYQALKHRFADMKSWLEAGHAISDAAAAAVADNSPHADELTSAAKAFVGDYGGELGHECVQLHGGIGVTYEHDLHLFLRRIALNRVLGGTPADHRQRLATIAENQKDVA